MDEDEILMLAEALGIDPSEVPDVVGSIDAFNEHESALGDPFGNPFPHDDEDHLRGGDHDDGL